MASEAISECQIFLGEPAPRPPPSLFTLKAYAYPSSQWPYQSTIASSGPGDIQFGLPAMHLHARRGVATQKFSSALRAPVAEPCLLISKSATAPWDLQKTMHTIPPNVYRTCEWVGMTQKSVCEPAVVTQETYDHNYFHTRSVVNKVHPNASIRATNAGNMHVN